jgi:hypothetical protein
MGYHALVAVVVDAGKVSRELELVRLRDDEVVKLVSFPVFRPPLVAVGLHPGGAGLPLKAGSLLQSAGCPPPRTGR